MAMHPALWVLGGLGLLTLGLALKPKSRFKGDDAKIGDVVHIPITSLPEGSLPVAIPPGAGLIAMQVKAESPDTLDGSIVAYVVSETPLQQIALPQPFGSPIHVQRSWVGAVYRDGRKVS